MKKLTAIILSVIMLLQLLGGAMISSAASTRAVTETGYDRGYAGGMGGTGSVVAHGLDVSTWQGGNIDFDDVKAAGYDFVILRCGYSGGKDSWFETFYTEAKAAGLDIGTYYYSYALTAQEAYQDALETLSFIEGKTFEYPVYLDYEDPTQMYLDDSLDQSICLTYMDTIASEGYLTGFYTSRSMSLQVPLSTICAKYEFWVAQYYDHTYQSLHDRYSTTTGMYQYTSEKYVGSWGPYDANVTYKDYPSIVKTYGFNGYEAGGGTTELPLDEGITNTNVSLKKGDNNVYVKQLQTSLNTIMNAGLLVDGDFGAGTEAAVISFQAKYGLVADGIVGAATIAKINDFIKNGVPEAEKTGYDRGYAGGRGGTGNVVAHGLDVSTWQGGAIDFSAVKAAGYDFVILRCGYSGGKDSWFETFYTEAKAAGLDVGVYYYTYALTAAEAYSDAIETLSFISGKTFEYPIYCDYEDPTQAELGSDLAQSICLSYLDTLASYGYLVGLYTSRSYSLQMPIDTICEKYELWIAQYYDNTYQSLHDRYSTTTGMFQYTSEKYIGSWGPYDANVTYKDYPSIVKTYGFNGYEAEGGTTEELPLDKGITSATVVLQKGDVNSYVKQLQASLNTLMNAELEVDGDFGVGTEYAVMRFQEKYGLTANGVVGYSTIAKINDYIENGAPEAIETGYGRGYAGGKGGTGAVAAHGLDVSAFQSSYINFADIKAAGYDFVILRCGYSGKKDSSFDSFYTEARAAGLDVGAYYGTYALTAEEAYADALETLSFISGKTFEYPIYMSYVDSSQAAFGDALDENICLTYMDTLASGGYLSGLYTNSSFAANLPLDTICERYEFWISDYYDNTYESKHDTYSTMAGMYQYTAEQSVNGKSPYDANVSYKDYPSIVKSYGFNGYVYDGGDIGGGDVDINIKISLLDIIRVLKFVVDGDTAVTLPDVDFDGDSVFTVGDILIMLNMFLNNA